MPKRKPEQRSRPLTAVAYEHLFPHRSDTHFIFCAYAIVAMSLKRNHPETLLASCWALDVTDSVVFLRGDTNNKPVCNFPRLSGGAGERGDYELLLLLALILTLIYSMFEP